jgi:hypothetical protein
MPGPSAPRNPGEAAIHPIPVELNLNGVYLPPWLAAALMGLALALALSQLANLTGLSRFVWHPPLFFAALLVACTVLLGTTLLPSFFG